MFDLNNTDHVFENFYDVDDVLRKKCKKKCEHIITFTGNSKDGFWINSAISKHDMYIENLEEIPCCSELVMEDALC